MQLVKISCRRTDDLNWQSILKEIVPMEPICWEFDLGLTVPYFPVDDELAFSSLRLALSTFTKKLWPLYSERTEGGILYRGSADFASTFHWSASQEENWILWKQDRKEADLLHLRRLFCADVFANYFQMLSHALPDELKLSLHFTVAGCGSLAEVNQLLSRERFEHFVVEPTFSKDTTAPLAVCFPEEAQCSQDILAKFNVIFQTLAEPYRIIAEPFLTESWEGVDRLYVLSEAITAQGKRKLMGFCAAGGVVIVEGESLGLLNEISSEEFRGRGI